MKIKRLGIVNEGKRDVFFSIVLNFLKGKLLFYFHYSIFFTTVLFNFHYSIGQGMHMKQSLRRGSNGGGI